MRDNNKGGGMSIVAHYSAKTAKSAKFTKSAKFFIFGKLLIFFSPLSAKCELAMSNHGDEG